MLLSRLCALLSYAIHGAFGCCAVIDWNTHSCCSQQTINNFRSVHDFITVKDCLYNNERVKARYCIARPQHLHIQSAQSFANKKEHVSEYVASEE